MMPVMASDNISVVVVKHRHDDRDWTVRYCTHRDVR